MDRTLEECYGSRRVQLHNVDENNYNKDANNVEAPREILKAVSDVVGPLNTLGVFTSLPTPLRYVKCSLNFISLADETNKFLYTEANMSGLMEIRRVLMRENFKNKMIDDVMNVNEALHNIYIQKGHESEDSGFVKNELSDRDYKKLYKYYYSSYDNMKKLSKEIDDALDIVKDEEKRKVLMDGKLALLHLREKVVLMEALDINSSNQSKCIARFCVSLMSFAADVITLITLPVLRGALLALQLPVFIGNAFFRFGEIIKKKIDEDKAKDADDEKVLTTVLQIPSLIAELWKVLDKHVFKKLRDKAEESRKREVAKKQLEFLANIKSEKTKEIINKLIVGEEDLEEKIRKLEESEDDRVKEALRLSKQTSDVLNAKPDKYLRLFKVKTLEDEERMNNIAKFTIRHIKELYILEKRLEEGRLSERVDKQRVVDQMKLSSNRMKIMIMTLGIKKDDVDGFIDDVKAYRLKKETEKRRNGGSIPENTQLESDLNENKENLIERLVKAMKSEE